MGLARRSVIYDNGIRFARQVLLTYELHIYHIFMPETAFGFFFTTDFCFLNVTTKTPSGHGTLLFRENDVVTSFSRNDGVIYRCPVWQCVSKTKLESCRCWHCYRYSLLCHGGIFSWDTWTGMVWSWINMFFTLLHLASEIFCCCWKSFWILGQLVLVNHNEELTHS